MLNVIDEFAKCFLCFRTSVFLFVMTSSVVFVFIFLFCFSERGGEEKGGEKRRGDKNLWV